MTLLDGLQTALVSEVDEYESPPGHLSVERTDEGDYVVEGSWLEDKSYESQGLEPVDEVGDGDLPTLPVPQRYEHILTGDLRARVDAQFERFQTHIRGGEMRRDEPTLVQTTAETVLDQKIGGDLAFQNLMVGETEQGMPDWLQEAICTRLRELDPNVHPDHLYGATFVFSDMHESQLVNIDPDIRTPNPHQYYSDVASLDEYLAIAEEKETIDTTGDTYEVIAKLRGEYGDIPTDVRDFAETRVLGLGTETIETPLEYVFEAETLDYTEDGRTEFALWVHVPVESNA